MDPMDILGSLLGGGGKSASSGGPGGGGGLGGKILSELLKGSTRKSDARPPSNSPPPAAPGPQANPNVGSSSTANWAGSRPISVDQQAEELEAMLGVARERNDRRQTGASPEVVSQPKPPTSRYRPAPAPSKFERTPTQPQLQPPTSTPTTPTPTTPWPQPKSASRAPTAEDGFGSQGSMTQDDEAIVLIRAMVNAAKADGRVTQAEQQAILGRISQPTPEALSFLRNELSQPLDVRAFCWTVPLGMEQQVYTLTLATIDLDTNPEADYLRQLAHGLRLNPEFCNQLHQRYGAPTIF